jgi:hypothetical protein
MGWSAIISAILAVVGPVIKEWLAKWLDEKLNKQAARMGVPREFSTASRELILAVRDRELWAWNRAKYRFLSRLAVTAPAVAASNDSLTQAEAYALRNLAAACG